MEILDCTFRGGGYYTDWNFSQHLTEVYLQTVSRLPITIVELGYLSNKKDLNKLIENNNNYLDGIRFAVSPYKIEKLLKKGLEIFTLTKSYLKVRQLNPWLND